MSEDTLLAMIADSYRLHAEPPEDEQGGRWRFVSAVGAILLALWLLGVVCTVADAAIRFPRGEYFSAVDRSPKRPVASPSDFTEGR